MPKKPDHKPEENAAPERAAGTGTGIIARSIST